MVKILCVLCLFVPQTLCAQSVCQTRWFGGGFYTTPATVTGVSSTTFSPFGQFTFDYPGEEGAADIITTGVRLPTVFVGGQEYVYVNGEKLLPFVPRGLTFDHYYVKADGRYSGPYPSGAVGLKLTDRGDRWLTAAVNKAYGSSVFVETWVLVRVCGSEDELLRQYGEER